MYKKSPFRASARGGNKLVTQANHWDCTVPGLSPVLNLFLDVSWARVFRTALVGDGSTFKGSLEGFKMCQVLVELFSSALCGLKL